MEQNTPTPTNQPIEHTQPTPDSSGPEFISTPPSPPSPDKGPLECDPPEPDCGSPLGRLVLRDGGEPVFDKDTGHLSKAARKRGFRARHWMLMNPALVESSSNSTSDPTQSPEK